MIKNEIDAPIAPPNFEPIAIPIKLVIIVITTIFRASLIRPENIKYEFNGMDMTEESEPRTNNRKI